MNQPNELIEMNKLQVGIQATLEQLRAYKAGFPMAKFKLPENVPIL